MHASRARIATLKILKNRADFLNATKHGRRWTSQSLVLQAVPGKTGETRLGFTVSKKTEKSAVRRNRIRRRLRAAAFEVLSGRAAPGHDYVLIGRPEALTRAFAQIRSDLRWCLKKLELWREEGQDS